MKKTALILVALLSLAVLPSAAQNSFQLGLKTGFNSTSFDTKNYSFDQIKEDYKGGYMLGAYSRIGLLGNLSLQPELYYSKKSSRNDFNILGQQYNQTLSYYSWDIPILAHLKVLDLKVFNLYGLAGPVASFRVNENSSLSQQIGEQWQNDRFRNHNWNFQLGAGLEVMRFNIDFRYEWGLNDMSSTSDFETKSKALLFSLSYRLIGF